MAGIAGSSVIELSLAICLFFSEFKDTQEN